VDGETAHLRGQRLVRGRHADDHDRAETTRAAARVPLLRRARPGDPGLARERVLGRERLSLLSLRGPGLGRGRPVNSAHLPAPDTPIVEPGRQRGGRRAATTLWRRRTLSRQPGRRYSPRERCGNTPGPAAARPDGPQRELTIRPPCRAAAPWPSPTMRPAARTSWRSWGPGYDGPPRRAPPLTREASSTPEGRHSLAPLRRGATVDDTRT
jgi:hypothetical protein